MASPIGQCWSSTGGCGPLSRILALDRSDPSFEATPRRNRSQISPMDLGNAAGGVLPVGEQNPEGSDRWKAHAKIRLFG